MLLRSFEQTGREDLPLLHQYPYLLGFEKKGGVIYYSNDLPLPMS